MQAIHPKISYLVYDDGRISKIRGTGYKIPTRQVTGYQRISARGKTWLVHRLVWEAFNGEIPKGLQINHIDGNKANNALSNLEIVTPKENIRHAYLMGLKTGHPGESNSMAKLTNDDYMKIIDELVCGATNDEIAAAYGLHSRYVSLIRHRRRLIKLWERYEENNPGASAQNSPGLLSDIPLEKRLAVIRKLNSSTNKELGQSLNIDPSVISRVRHRKSWLDAWEVIDSNVQRPVERRSSKQSETGGIS